MKKVFFRIVLLCLSFILLFTDVKPVFALEGTSYTGTLAINKQVIPTQDAYLPAGIYLSDIGLSAPEDMFLEGRTLYIADSGNKRIVVYDLDTGNIETFGEDALSKPTGISVASDGRIFVADYDAAKVKVFSKDHTLQSTVEHPTEPYYGRSPYKPQKVDLDSYDNLFVISEGSCEGILQFDRNAHFNGFFGANRTKGLSFVEWFQKTFYTDEQKAHMTFRTPPNIVSLDVADNDMVFSVTQNDRWNSVKKLNMAGVNVFAEGEHFGRADDVDVAVRPDGGFYTVSSSGKIAEYSETGVCLLEFASEATASDRNGLTAVASAIETDADGNIYILDKERGVLQVWYPTEYANLLHKAESDFKNGQYADALTGWGEILRMNPNAYMSHEGYAKALFQLGRYEEAATHFELIEHKSGYSDCFWEIRSEWMRSHMEMILVILAMIAAVIFVLNLLDKKYGYREIQAERFARTCKKRPLLKALTADIAYFLRHPIDGVYYIKTGVRGSVTAASILYVVALAVYMICRGLTSFVFGGGYSSRSNPVAILLIAVVPSALFVVGSYLISSINDGKGTFRQVYTVFAYCLSLFIICWPLLTLLSHALTLTEIFIYQLLSFLILGYTAVLIFIGIKEAHIYNLKKTLANILLTLFFAIVAILAVIILFILWRELVSFAGELFEEVRYRVFS